MTTPCPICSRPVALPQGDTPIGTYPFCTERCKLVDLGRWLDGRYQIPVVDPDEEGRDDTAELPDFDDPPAGSGKR